MKVILLIMFSTFLSAAEPQPMPPVGRYVFIEPFSLTGCAKYEGGRGTVNHCLKQETKHYAKGDLLEAREFFWDDREKDFGVKVIYLETFRRVPLKYLKFSPVQK